MGLEISIISAHRQSTERDEALATVFSFSFVNVFLDLVYDVVETAFPFVVVGDKAVH